MLQATKTRHGFPPLYIQSVVTGATKKSKLRFLNKFQRRKFTLDVTVPETRLVGVGTPWPHYLFRIQEENQTTDFTIDRITGMVEYANEGSPAFNSTTIAAINSAFATHRGTSGGVTTTTTAGVLVSSLDYGQFHVDVINVKTVEIELIGVDVVRFYYQEKITSVVVDLSPGPSWMLVGDVWTEQVTEYEVYVENEYEDEVFKADIDDLFNIAGNGIADMPDNSVGFVSWNENGVNSGLGDPVAGACALLPSSLDSYTAVIDPEVTLDYTTDATSYVPAGGGRWWQHAGGSSDMGEVIPPDEPYSIFSCTFTDETSMPGGNVTDERWEVVRLGKVWFNSITPICATMSLVDGAGTTSEECVAGVREGNHIIVTQNHPTANANSDIVRATGWSFTSPGYLTAGDCPCSGAP